MPRYKHTTLARAVRVFLAGKRATTATSYSWDLKPMVAYLGPDKPLQVTEDGQRFDFFEPPDLTEYVNLGLLSRDPPLAPATVEKHKKTMRTFWNWCRKNGYINESPFRVPAKKLAGGVDPAKIMPDHLLNQLLNYTQWDTRAHAVVLFLAQTGCRCGGAAKLTLDRLDLPNKRAVVVEKGEKAYTVYYDDVAAAALGEWLRTRATLGNIVFSKTGRPITSAALGQYFRRLCKDGARIGSWGPHSLRHRRGDQLQRAGVDPKTAARVLGHTNYMTTLEYYYHEDEQHIEQAARDTLKADDPRGKMRRFGG